MSPGALNHLDDEQLDRYSLGSTPEQELPDVEQHLLLCEACRERLDRNDAYISAMRQASKKAPVAAERPRFSSWIWRPMWSVTFAAVLLLVAFALWKPGSSAPPVAVSLYAVRGADPNAHAPAHRRIALAPDLTGLAAYPYYRVEVVDNDGSAVTNGRIQADSPRITIPPLNRGTYFVRLYAPSGEILREFGLQIEP